MAIVSHASFLKVCNIGQQFLKEFHISSVCANIKWKEERRLPKNPNSFGPLTNLPDYSFKDNRPVPYGTNQKRRIDVQQEFLHKIKKLAGEIDNAVIRHEQLQEKIREDKQKILELKLKEKGSKLVTSSSAVKL